MSYGEVQRYCPDDQLPLVKVEDRGVIIDCCQRCGIQVLDAGELQMIISTVARMDGFRPPVMVERPVIVEPVIVGGGGYYYRSSDAFFGSFFSS